MPLPCSLKATIENAREPSCAPKVTSPGNPDMTANETTAQLRAPDGAIQPSLACRFCKAPLSHTFVDLGMSPLCESFLSAAQINQMEAFFPLHVQVCGNCFL